MLGKYLYGNNSSHLVSQGVDASEQTVQSLSDLNSVFAVSITATYEGRTEGEPRLALTKDSWIPSAVFWIWI